MNLIPAMLRSMNTYYMNMKLPTQARRVTMCDTRNQGFERNGTYITKYHRFKNCKTKPVEHSVTSTRFQGFHTTLNTDKVSFE